MRCNVLKPALWNRTRRDRFVCLPVAWKRLAAAVRRRPHLLLAAAGVLAALAVRHPLLPFVSRDVRTYLTPWWVFIVENGYFAALRHEDFSNYSAPYLYLLASAAFLTGGAHSLVTIKTISIVFDFVLAFFVGKCVSIRYPESKTIPVAAALATLFAPTVVANSAMWGQADATYTAFLAGCLYFLLTGRQAWAFAAFGLAFSFKLQALFLAPAFLWLLAKKAVHWRYFLLSPLVWLVTLLPAWFLGRPFGGMLTIYPDQVVLGRVLNANVSNVYLWVPQDWYDWYPLFVVLAAAVLVAIAVVVHRSRAHVTPELTVFLATFSVILVPYILPKMHDRYFFPADVFAIVLAFYRPRAWYVPVVVGAASSVAYLRYLFQRMEVAHTSEEIVWDVVPLTWGAVLLGVLVVVLARRLFADLQAAPQGPRPTGGAPGPRNGRWRRAWGTPSKV